MCGAYKMFLVDYHDIDDNCQQYYPTTKNNYYKMSVKGLHSGTTNEDLFSYFHKFGEIKSCQIEKRNRISSSGYVEFAKSYIAELVQKLGPHIIKGKIIKTKPYQLNIKHKCPSVVVVTGTEKFTKNELLKGFRCFGKVLHISKISSKSQINNGHYVTFGDEDSAERCVKEPFQIINGKVVKAMGKEGMIIAKKCPKATDSYLPNFKAPRPLKTTFYSRSDTEHQRTKINEGLEKQNKKKLKNKKATDSHLFDNIYNSSSGTQETFDIAPRFSTLDNNLLRQIDKKTFQNPNNQNTSPNTAFYSSVDIWVPSVKCDSVAKNEPGTLFSDSPFQKSITDIWPNLGRQKRSRQFSHSDSDSETTTLSKERRIIRRPSTSQSETSCNEVTYNNLVEANQPDGGKLKHARLASLRNQLKVPVYVKLIFYIVFIFTFILAILCSKK